MFEKIKEILNDLRQDKTVILATHQKEMTRLVDKIIVMHNGLIMREGTHEKLMKTNEYYSYSIIRDRDCETYYL